MSDKNIEKNANHIDENSREIKNNTKLIHILYIFIIVLMMVIAGLAFYVGTMFGNTGGAGVVTAEDVTITVIDDTRCTECQTDTIVSQLKALPFLVGAEFVERDFSDDEVAEYLNANSITLLPAIIFSTNILNDAGQIAPYLTALPEGEFSLALQSTFNPFAERSDRGFLAASDEVKNEIKETARYTGAEDAELTWIEYTDIKCPYCKQIVTDGTAETLLEKYDGKLNKNTVNFIGVGGNTTQVAAEVFECVASVSNADAYNTVFKETIVSGNSGKDQIIEYAVSQGVDKDALELCVTNGDSRDIVARKFAIGREEFGVTGTPGNVIINNKTGEYTLISGAVPAASFEPVIESLLQ